MEKPFIHITFQHANYTIITNGIRVLVRRWALSRETYVHVQYMHVVVWAAANCLFALIYSACTCTFKYTRPSTGYVPLGCAYTIHVNIFGFMFTGNSLASCRYNVANK